MERTNTLEGVIIAFMERGQDPTFTHIVYIYSDNQKKPMLVPRQIFDNASSEPGLSKSLREQLSDGPNRFCLLDFVQLTVAGDEVIAISKLSKTRATRSDLGDAGESKLLISCQCAVSADSPRRCWAELFGEVPVDEKLAQRLAPNVIYKGWVHIRARRHPKTGAPQHKCMLDSVEDVQMGPEREYTSMAPWSEKTLDLEEEPVGYGPIDICELTNSRQSRASNVHPKKSDKPIDARGFIVDSQQRTVFVPQLPGERTVAAFSKDDTLMLQPPLGLWVRFKMIYVKSTKQFVAGRVKRDESGNGVVVREQKGVTEFQLRVRCHPAFPGYYLDERLGDALIAGIDLRHAKGSSQTVWAHFSSHSKIGKFRIVGSSAQTRPRFIEGTAFVIDDKGNCYSQQFAVEEFLVLGRHLCVSFKAGDSIDFQAVNCSSSRRRYVILHAEASTCVSFKNFAPVLTQKGIVYKLPVGPVRAGNAVYHQQLGMIEDPYRLAARHKPISDAWIGFNENRERETVFRVYYGKDPTKTGPRVGTIVDINSNELSPNEIRNLASTLSRVFRDAISNPENQARLQQAGLYHRFLEFTQSPSSAK